jgi:P4 family phage/plasmid primase-like protien
MVRRKTVLLITADEKVSIPRCLIDALKPFGARFIKVCAPIVGDAKSGKKAVENGWLERRYEADDIELTTWLEGGGNYGVVCGEGLHAIDLDDKPLQEKFEQYVETLTVKTGRIPEGRHYFVRTDCAENGMIFSDPDKDGKRKNLGNIQVRNKYVVGAGCYHYSGKKYEVIKDVPIAWITKKELEEIFGENLAWSKQRLSEEQAQIEMDFGFDIPIADVIDLTLLRQIGQDEFQGAHPIHGSEGGNNFTVNTRKNCWHCFRCNSGGGALSWLAVKHKIIECHEAQKGNLKGELFKKVLVVAKKDGFEVDLGNDDEELSPEVAKYFEKRKFMAAYLATELMGKFHYVTRKTDEMIFVYHQKHGTYTPDGKAHLKTHTRKALGKYLTRNRLSEVINFVTCSTLKDTDTTPSHLILVKNGLLNIKTGKLEDFSPDYFILNVVPVRYDPNAKINAIENFVKEIIHPDDVSVLQESAGYCLWREYPIHVAIMLIGEGANGKSTWLELLRAFLGNENVSTEPLQSFEANRFSLGCLFGKLANVYADLSDRALVKTGNFKMLTGGDTISAEYKFRDRFNFKNYAKLIFSANKIPESKDDTTAFFRRWIIINFPKQFLPDNPKTDPQLLKKLTTEAELSGFLNWCLEGLRRLIENNKFSKSRSIEETREQYLRSSDPVKAFAMDRLEYKAGSAIPKTEVYKAFIEYCQEMKLPTVSQVTFAAKLVECMPNTKSARKRIEGTQTYCWEDLAMGVCVVCANQTGISTKVNEIGLKKYIESGGKREKGYSDSTVVSWEDALKGE